MTCTRAGSSRTHQRAPGVSAWRWAPAQVNTRWAPGTECTRSVASVISPRWRASMTSVSKSPALPAPGSTSTMPSFGMTQVTAWPAGSLPLSRTVSTTGAAVSSASPPVQRSRPWPGESAGPSHTPWNRFWIPTRSATRALRGAVWICAGVPSCSTRPPSITTSRSASMRASFRSCVTSTMGMASSRRRSASRRYRPWRFIWSTAEKGSSNSSSRGSRASARATATRCCCPPDSVAGRRACCSALSPTWSSQCRACFRRSACGRCSSESATLPRASRCGISA